MKKPLLLLISTSLLTGCVALPVAGVATLAEGAAHHYLGSSHKTQVSDKKKTDEPATPVAVAPAKLDKATQEALMESAFTVTPQLLQLRSMETRRYDGIQEPRLLGACADLLQDLGYNIENTDTTVGVLSASKEADATDRREQIGNFFNKLFRRPQKAMSKDQTIHVSIVLKPVNGSDGQPLAGSYIARVSFQRVLRKTDGSEVKETLREPKLYQEFYQRLSKAIFLEGRTA